MKKIKILIVDDASFMRDIVRKGVKAVFPAFTIKESSDGSQAKAAIKQEPFDLILCDWEMPKMSGVELLQWVRDESEQADVPFVLVTSRGDKEHVVQAVQLKATNYIVKPFTNDKLSDVVSKALTKSLGISAAELRKIATAKQGGISGGSTDVLTASFAGGLTGDLPVAEKIDSADIINKPEPRIKKPSLVGRPKEQTIAQLRWQSYSAKCLIKEISLDTLTAVIRRDDNIPAIMEMVVFDLVSNGGKDVSRINGYTHQLQAREVNAESEFVNITVRFVDENDEQKRAHLTRFINSLK